MLIEIKKDYRGNRKEQEAKKHSKKEGFLWKIETYENL